MKNKKFWCCNALVSLACIAVYFPILGHDFLTAWDDGWQVFNEYTETWSLANFWYILTEYYHGQFSPSNQILYTILHRFVGYHPACFHLMSLILHIGNSLLIFIILRRILIFRLTAEAEHKILSVSLGVALLFAIHPLQVESVAWISASKILVYTFFYLLALWFYLCFLEKGKKGIFYFAVLLCYVVSFGGKEQAIMLPLCLLLIDYVYRRNFRESALWYEKMPIMVLTVVFVYTTMESTGHVQTLVSGQTYPLLHRFVFTCYAFFEYIVKTFFPFNLLYLYPFPMLIGEPLPTRFWIYPALLLVIGAGFWKFFWQRYVLLGLLWFVIHISMMLHILPLPRLSIVADRYIYLAFPGLFFIMAWYIYSVWEMRAQYRRWIFAGCIAFLLLLGAIAHHRANVWHDNASLKRGVQEMLFQRRE